MYKDLHRPLSEYRSLTVFLALFAVPSIQYNTRIHSDRCCGCPAFIVIKH